MTHLKHIEGILEYIVNNTKAVSVIDVLCDEVKDIIEAHITFRDIDNFIAYFTFLLSSSHIPKELIFDQNLVMAFIQRTYAQSSDKTQMRRVVSLCDYISKTIPMDIEIRAAALKELETRLAQDRHPNLNRVIQRVRIGLVLKWLQGPLEHELSAGLRDYIVFLATLYGQYRSDRVISVDWSPCNATDKDREVLRREYAILEHAMQEALQAVRSVKAGESTGKYQDEFRVVLLSLDALVKRTKAGKLDSNEAFKDKVLVATTLMYIQDEFVEKDAELQKLIQLFVSLYHQFRDKHYDSHEQRNREPAAKE